MSALGQCATLRLVRTESALAPKAVLSNRSKSLRQKPLCAQVGRPTLAWYCDPVIEACAFPRRIRSRSGAMRRRAATGPACFPRSSIPATSAGESPATRPKPWYHRQRGGWQPLPHATSVRNILGLFGIPSTLISAGSSCHRLPHNSGSQLEKGSCARQCAVAPKPTRPPWRRWRVNCGRSDLNVPHLTPRPRVRRGRSPMPHSSCKILRLGAVLLPCNALDSQDWMSPCDPQRLKPTEAGTIAVS
jgi:hypothetical protein